MRKRYEGERIIAFRMRAVVDAETVGAAHDALDAAARTVHNQLAARVGRGIADAFATTEGSVSVDVTESSFLTHGNFGEVR